MLRRLTVAWVALIGVCGLAQATLPDQVELVQGPAVANSPLPVDASGQSAATFTVSESGNYTIAVVDLGVSNQQPLGTLAVSVATSTASVAQFSAAMGVFSGASSKTVALTAGTSYTVQPLASAASGLQGGSLSVTVTPQAGGTATFSDVGGNSDVWAVSAASAPANPGESFLSDQFTVSTADTYTLTLTDQNFPAGLSTVVLTVLNAADGSTVTSSPPLPIETPAPVSFSAQFTLQPGTYDIFAAVLASSPTLAGLYSLQVTGSVAGVVYAKTEAVGALPAATAIAKLTAADTISLQLADAAYPAALNGLQGVVTEGAAVLQTIAAPGSYQIMATAGTPQLYVWATVGAGGQGAYAAYASDSTGTLLDTAQPVLDSTHFGYAFTPSSHIGADSYTLGLNEYAQLPAFATLSAAVVQHAAKLAELAVQQGLGAVTTFAAQAGTLTIVVFPTLASGANDSLFGVDLASASTGTVVLNATQGVGALFSSSTFSIASSGNYLLQATDLQFPAALSNFYVILTSGQSVVAQILLGGQTTFTVNAPGSYVLNVLTEPGSGQNYGQYGVNLSQPPAPTVKLSASPTSVASGATTTLTWSSTNATSCTASGAWSGSLGTSGSQQSAALSAASTFDLSCTGAGGTASASAQVSINANNSGGGGAIDARTLLALLLLAFGTCWRRTARARRP
jgi:hypothetical protein